MENIEAPKPSFITPKLNNKILNSKKYELKYEKEIYTLIIEISDKSIIFSIRNSNKISFYNYESILNYDEITKKFLLLKDVYTDLNKVLDFFDLALTKEKINLEYNKENNAMILILKKVVDFNEVECKLELNQNQIEKDEIIKLLINEINEIRNNKTGDIKNNDMVKKLIEKNEEYEKRIKYLEEKNKIFEDEINKYKENNFRKEHKKLFNNFKKNPQNLKFKYEITNERSDSGNLNNFDIFIGLKDKMEYIIYNNNNNYNLDIMRIYDKNILTSLKGHNKQTNVIRYYLRNISEDYILSCDWDRFIIIWDIQNNFNKKYILQAKYTGIIFDALLLFNIYNKDFILLSSAKENEFSELYEFKDNTPFIKNIYGTSNNQTSYMIPWLYKDEYYIIDCCIKDKISINNLLEEESYTSLYLDSKGMCCCGYIYNDIYLCVSDWKNNNVKIFDLINKTLYKQINHSLNHGCGIIPWNNIYAIIGCKGYFGIINIEEGKMVLKIKYNESRELRGVKIMKIKNLGECLICSSKGNAIGLFGL